MKYLLLSFAIVVGLSGIISAQDNDQLEDWFPNGHGLSLDNPIASNDDWAPIEQDFDGVIMMLVPAGCFMMGADVGSDFHHPPHEQCFEEPFWIDKFEVDTEQYGAMPEEDYCLEAYSYDFYVYPRNCVNWFEAVEYCQMRDARLPTEREWEYAARGPDSLMYPWGNEFIRENTVISGTGLEPIHRYENYAGGASWVGAFHLIDNLAEWTSSLAKDYPYTSDSEDMDDVTSKRIFRGGSFSFSAGLTLRTTSNPYLAFAAVGLRCVRDFEYADS